MTLTAEVPQPMTDRRRAHAPASGEFAVGREAVLSDQQADHVTPRIVLAKFGAKFGKFGKLSLKLRYAAVRVSRGSKRHHYGLDAVAQKPVEP